MDNPKLRLWFAYPTQALTEPQLEACIALLAPAERDRMARFRFEGLRREFLASRVTQRMALSYGRAESPEFWRFRLNSWGKPAVDTDTGLRFNVSNCPRLVVCVTAEGLEVGVDAEPYERASAIAALAGEVFSPFEQEQLNALGADDRPARALTLWVLKEAWIKAHGMGMSLPLPHISFLFDESGDIRLELGAALRENRERSWRYRLLDHAGHRIALVAETSAACTLEARALSPLLAPPRDVDVAPGVWYPGEHP